MISSPLSSDPLFHIGPVPITSAVMSTWVIIALMAVGAFVLSRNLKIKAGPIQTVMELIVESIDSQIRDTMQADPAPYRPLIGTLFLYILIANWTSLIPGVEPPTAHLETDAALAGIVAVATVYFGLRVQGLKGYLRTFAEPTWVMIPLNIVEQITRTFSLFIRLFGNVMSGVFVIGVLLSVAGLFVPIPLMALDLLTSSIQAYIFAILATVFIGAAVNGDNGPEPDPSLEKGQT
jgi:F-type H+-transporting ATPase subunit a